MNAATGAVDWDVDTTEPDWAYSITGAPRVVEGLVVIGNAEFLSDFVAQALSQVGGGFFVENLRFLQNTIDWVGLDNDMLSIRARGAAARRLYLSERGSEGFIEVVSYAIPTLTLFGFGGWLHWRRRQTRSLAGPPAGGGIAPANPRRTEV